MSHHHDIALDVDNSEEEIGRSAVEHWQAVTTTRKSVTKDAGNRSNRKGSIIKKIIDPQGQFLPMWNKIFIISCVFAVSLDPLFFYIPIINKDMKCLMFDKKLKTITLVSRSLTDRFYMVDILLQILTISIAKSSGNYGPSSNRKKAVKDVLAIANRIFRSYLLIDILAVLPIPQVVIFIFFLKMRGSRSSKTKFLNSLVLLQYVPRILRIYLLCNERNLIPRKAGIWVKSIFNFFLYILASHVLGALWYFVSIHRESTCWQYACRRENGCEPSTLDCDDHTYRNITLINDLCPINPTNATLFDFGIFVDALQSGILRSTDFPQKFLICFWWGLRNISSLGQNLQTSTNAMENLFAVFISITGLLLLVYLIGNLQTYLQFSTTSSEKVRRKMKTKDLELDLWLSRKGLPKYLKEVILPIVQQKLEQNKDVQVENILSVLPVGHGNFIKRYLRLTTLQKVPMLQTMDEKLLKAICVHLKPMNYNEETMMIREEDKLDKMFFIRQGIVRTYRTNGKGGSKLLQKLDFYGGEVLNWASNFSSSDEDLRRSTRNVKSVNKVEVFALMASDLKTVFTKFWWHFTKDKPQLYPDFSVSQLEQLEKLAVGSIAREVRRRQEAKTKKQHTITSKNAQLGSNHHDHDHDHEGNRKLQRIVSRVLRDQVASPRTPRSTLAASQGNQLLYQGEDRKGGING